MFNPWNDSNFFAFDQMTNSGNVYHPIVEAAYKNGTIATSYKLNGALNFKYEDAVAKLIEMGGRKVRVTRVMSGQSSDLDFDVDELNDDQATLTEYPSTLDEINSTFMFPWGVVLLSVNGRRDNGAIGAQFTDMNFCQPIIDLATSWLRPFPPPAADLTPIYGFSFDRGKYLIDSIGDLSDELIRENYSTDVTTGFDYVTGELSKPDPRGRLVLVEGVPGTGKTRMIRSLICALKDSSMCVIVPPSLLDNLSGPDFTRCLIQHSQGNAITLILEDADDCLIAREKNKGAKANLSALLNLSDGILGAAMNLRVVATTNQELKEIDRAILRPGRLLRRIHVGPLSAEQATNVHKRLNAENAKVYTGPTILAEVYENAFKVEG